MEAKLSVHDYAGILGLSVQGVYKRIEKMDIPQKFIGKKLYFDHADGKKIFNFNFQQKIYAVQIIKGGVGKTTTVVSLALQANLLGARVLMIDADKQGNLTESFKVSADTRPVLYDLIHENLSIEDCIVNVSEGLDIIPSRIDNGLLDRLIMLKNKNIKHIYERILDPVLNNYDLIIFDCPPELGLSVASIALFTQNVICPVIPDKYSIAGLKLNYKEYAELESEYKIVINKKILFNKFDSRISLSHDLYAQLLQHPTYQDNLLKTFLRVNQDFVNAIAYGSSIFENLKKSTAKEDISLITLELLGLNALVSIK